MFASRGLLKIASFIPPSVARRTIFLSACSYGIRSRWRAPLFRELYKRHQQLEAKGEVPPNIRSEYIEWNYDSELFAFGKRLKEEFDETTLRQALTDISYIESETRKQVALGVETPALQVSSNCDLANAGKALIEDYSLKYVRATHPLLPEEGVRTIVDYLTSEKAISEIGLGIGLRDIILTEEQPPSVATLAKGFQAVVSAVNISSGINSCQKFIQDFVLTQLVGKDIYDIWQVDEPLKTLSEIMARSGVGAPEPRLVFQSGQKTIEAVYQVALYSDKQFIGTGYGESTDVAVEQAASDALRRLFHITASSDPLPFGEESKNIMISDKENLSILDWSTSKAKNIVMC